jgi:hypothetical protein
LCGLETLVQALLVSTKYPVDSGLLVVATVFPCCVVALKVAHGEC